MANYKAVDADRLDGDLTLVAEAIRKRAGTSEKLAFPEGMAETVRNIPAEGAVLPDLSNPGGASDLAYDKQLIDAYGNVVTGTLEEATEGTVIGANSESAELSVGQLFVAQGVFRPDMVEDKDFGIIARAGARLVVQAPAENLGDAAAEDVAKGKTFTSANGLKVTGTHECEAGVTLPALSNPAAATDLALDKQLIDANGNVITGTLPETEVGTKIYGGTGIQISGTPGSTTFHMGGIYLEDRIGDNTLGFIGRPGAQFWVRNAPTSLFGDATPDQVAKGATFTSAAGLQVEGTLEAASGGEENFVALSGVLYTKNTVLEQTESPLAWYPSFKLSDGMYFGAEEMETFTTNYSGLLGSARCMQLCTKLKEAYFPKATGFWLGNTNFFGDNPALEKVSVGSIGCPVVRMDAGSFKTPPITLELYVDATTIADIPTLITNNVPGMWNAEATVIYRNSTTGEVITE